MGQAGALCATKAITVRSTQGEKFDRIVGYELGEKPNYREPGMDEDEPSTATICGFSEEDLPF